MDLYEYCTGNKLKSGYIYQVAYVDWRGDWVMDDKEFKGEASAKKHSKAIGKEKALNGRVSVRMMPRSRVERTKLQANINKF